MSHGSFRPGKLFRGLLLASIVGMVATAACDDSPSDSGEAETFTVRTGAETFRVRVTHAPTIVDLEERRDDGTIGVVIGTLRAGDGGFNAPWSWHLDPGSVRAVDAAIEVCDGTADMVEADLEYWLELGQFCPWGAEIVDE